VRSGLHPVVHALPQPSPALPVEITLLKQNCTEVRFAPGDVLRRKGQHYNDMYLLVHGSAEVDLQSTRGGKMLLSNCGAPVGEMGFLTGRAASATVTARSDIAALVIDDPTLNLLEREQPRLAAHLLQHLTTVADERTSYNVSWEPAGARSMGAQSVDVYLCRSPEMLEDAQRLRYEVYCEELGRQSPYADHSKRIISDQLDRTGQVLVARRGDETIGTLRGNGAWEQELGIYEELYGMKYSIYHPDATAIISKFIVKKSHRRGPAARKLIAALVRHGRDRVKECYIDCIPALLPYYRAIGFELAGPQFVHRENGLSFPMKLDVVKHGERLSRDPGMGDYLRLYLKAKAFKLIARIESKL
jgi:predicted GNAT family N-acyltransferase